MRVDVDRSLCNGHGECVIEAPSVFALPDDSDVAVVLTEDVPEDRRAQVQRAAALCPVAAVRIDELA